MREYIVLLRGVMPRGRNKVPMAELRAALSAAGLGEVRTYIQSGNLLVNSALDQAAVETVVRETIMERLGPTISVIARSPSELRAVLEENPFRGEETARQYFSLLATAPSPELVRAFHDIEFAPDRVRITDRAIYTLYATKHSDSRFTNNFFERRLKVAITTRNFNTISRLLSLSGQ